MKNALKNITEKENAERREEVENSFQTKLNLMNLLLLIRESRRIYILFEDRVLG